ncbi:MAG: hypothetical protein LBB88_12115 [Planctomycetaceae bacterium]|nr:hypothetical protein [Planctomycetaceae bacterium]
MILIIVESILSLPSATQPFAERLRTYGRLPSREIILHLQGSLKSRRL